MRAYLRSTLRPIAGVCILLLSLPLTGATASRQQNASAQELKDARAEVPELARVLELSPGMTVADVGAGAGAMTLVMAHWLGADGRIYATDINEPQLRAIREQAARDGLANVVTLAGAQGSTNLPDRCCDAIWLRNVYHHLTDPAAIDDSLLQALEPGGRLAVIDFEPRPGSPPPPNLPADRTGHGVDEAIVERELTAAGFEHVRTYSHWLSDSSEAFLVLVRKPARPGGATGR